MHFERKHRGCRKRAVRANIPVSEYGPRWSCSITDLTTCDPEAAAIRLVDDVSFYDQLASIRSASSCAAITLAFASTSRRTSSDSTSSIRPRRTATRSRIVLRRFSRRAILGSTSSMRARRATSDGFNFQRASMWFLRAEVAISSYGWRAAVESTQRQFLSERPVSASSGHDVKEAILLGDQ